MHNALLDRDFLKALDETKYKETWARITALNNEESPLEYIEGKVTGGSLNIDGSSSVRRTCNLTMIAENVNINEFYWGLKNKFKLEEVNDKSFEKITNSFKGGGSNKPIATVIWYISLLKLRKEFNESAIDFPVVFDSPNNAETDLEKKGQLYKYIVENTPKDNQLIVSGIGYESAETFGIPFDNVIRLENDKYHLLCSEDYTAYSQILTELCSK